MAYDTNQEQLKTSLIQVGLGMIVGFATAILLDKDKRQVLVKRVQDIKDKTSDKLQDTADDWGDRGHQILDRLEAAIDGLQTKKGR